MKEMLLRALDRAEAVRPGGRGESVEVAEAHAPDYWRSRRLTSLSDAAP